MSATRCAGCLSRMDPTLGEMASGLEALAEYISIDWQLIDASPSGFGAEYAH